MKRIRQLSELLRELNGLMARTKKDPSRENKDLLTDCVERLKVELGELVI